MRDNYLLRTFTAEGDDHDTSEAFNKLCREQEALGWYPKMMSNVVVEGEPKKYKMCVMIVFEYYK